MDSFSYLACGHIEFKQRKCATTDCPNFIGVQKAMYLSMLAVAALLLYVRVVTGRGAISIILDALPSVFS